MAITTLIGAVFSNKLIITGLSAAFVLISYVVNTIASAVNTSEVPILGFVEKISVYNYLGSEGVVIDNQLNIGNITVLLVITAVAIVMSVYAFENRDISG
jgi:ABC-type transport system involved in multi-copper enzyme maturation permease subunit